MNGFTGGAGFLGKFLQGLAQGKMYRAKREEEAELRKDMQSFRKVQEQMLKTQQEEIKRKAAREARQEIYDQEILKREGIDFTGGAHEAKRPEPTPMGASFDTGDITDRMSGRYMEDLVSKLSPAGLMAYSRLTGQNWMEAGKLSAQIGRYGALDKQAAARLEQQKRANDIRELALLGGHAGTREVYDEGQGGYISEPIPKIGAERRVVKPTPANMPIPAADIPTYMNKEGLNPKFGMTPKQAETAGFRKLTTGQVDAAKNFGTVEGILDQVEVLMNKVFPKTETGLGRITGGASRKLGAMTQVNLDAAALEKLIDGTLAPIIRSLGEKGALSDTDVIRARQLFARLTDRADVAWKSFGELQKVVANAKRVRLGFAKEELPEIAKGQLSEGVLTEFKNGQVWTLTNGKPERIK